MNSYNSSLTNTYSDRQPTPLSRSEHTTVSKENRPVSESVREGQQLRGEIINRTTTDVTIRLSNGQTLQARLDVSVPLSIGQTASFEVTHADAALISLRILQDESAFAQNALIQKALTAAELPITSRNAELVNTLLQHNLPISKESILSLIRQSNAYPNTDINTLAILTQHKLPVTQATLTQFEAYQNYEHQILPQLANLAHALSEIAANPNPSFSGLAQIIQNYFSSNASATPEPLPNVMPNPIATGFESSTTSPLPSVEMIPAEVVGNPEPLPNTTQSPAATNAGPFSQNLLYSAETVPPMLHPTENGQSNAVGNSKLHYIATTPPAESVSEPLMQTSLPSAGNPELHSDATQTQAVTAPESFLQHPLHPKETIITEPLRHSTPQGNPAQAPTFLSSEPLSQSLLRSAENVQTTGSEPATQNPAQSSVPLFPFVTAEIPQDNFVQHLLTRWTLSPQELANPDKVKEFYHQLRKDLTELQNALPSEETLRTSHSNETPDGPLERLLSDTAGATARLQDNLEFMHMLNRIFPYVQLPIRFSDKTTHGELYVYTKKEKLRHENSSISVLLHLDMEALGPTDIHLSLTGNRLTSRFYLNDPAQEALFSEHLPELKETLASKGFDTSFELIPRKQEENPVREFLNSHDTSGLSRFTFDCRA